MKESILTDIEIDFEQLKCLLKAIQEDDKPMLREAAKRNIQQMKAHLDSLYKEINADSSPTPSAPQPPVIVVEKEATIIKEEVYVVKEEVVEEKPEKAVPASNASTSSIRHFLSLNDTFLFSRELFDGNTEKMNNVIRKLDEKNSLEEALSYLNSVITPDEENEATLNFLEILRKRFNNTI